MRYIGMGILPLLLGCGVIIHGTRQTVAVSSQPPGARVTVDGEAGGVTPMSVKLRRKNVHTLKIELEGYVPAEITVSHHLVTWALVGSGVLGGVVGVVIDALTGGLWELTPEQ